MEALGSVAAVVQCTIVLAEKMLHEVDRQSNKNSKENVEHLKDILSKFQSFIKDQEAEQPRTHVSRDFLNKVIHVTAEIQDALDDFMFSVSIHYHTTRVSQFLSNQKHRLADQAPARTLSSARQKIQTYIDDQHILEHLTLKGVLEGIGGPQEASSHQYLVEDEMVGFTECRQELRTQLLSPDSKRALIQIVGSGGSGKTFLAKQVFRDPDVKKNFQCMAWIKLTNSFNPSKEVWLEELQKQILSQRDRKILDNAGNVEQKLQLYLEKKRYLIVLDDVWKKHHYAPIVNILPNNNSRSRILITSRNSSVADNPSFTHKLDGLIERDARNLFGVRAFGDRIDNSCPQGLKTICDKILNRCEGIPLAIVSVGSLLFKEQLVESAWEKFNDRLGLELGSNSDLPIARQILQPSFADLPYHLRSCFLHFSTFPENQPITRGRLIRSWMAEGFLNQTNLNSPEEAAEAYLNELIERSLVRVCESEINGRTRSCRLLRFHHELIVPLSQTGNLVTVIDDKSQNRINNNVKARRLSVQSDNFHTKLSQINDLSRVRTLFVFGKVDVKPKSSSYRSKAKKIIKGTFRSDELEILFCKFKLLKVVDLQGVPLEKLPDAVGSFNLLKCLNLRYTNLETIPRSIQNLLRLETLDLKYTKVKQIPVWINKLRNLRYLVASFLHDSANSTAQGVMVSSASIGELSYLQKLSLIKVNSYKGFSFSDLGRLVQLKKLGIVDLEENCGIKLSNAVGKMGNLLKLDVRSMANKHLYLDHVKTPPKHIHSLHLEGLLHNLPSWISKLSNLVKVVLKWSRLENENPFEGLEDLPSLMELEMVEFYTGKSVKFKAGKFKNLRKLHVERFDNLSEVVVENQALPVLESLTICKCKMLKPFPQSYPLRQLQELVVYDMNSAFIDDIQQRRSQVELVDHTQIPGKIHYRRLVS